MKSFRTAVLILTTLMLAVAEASAQIYTDLYNFDGIHGSNPLGVLAQGRNGGLYGTTPEGGTNQCPWFPCGVIFELSSRGLTVLYDFDNVHGWNPYSGLTLGSDGNFYGTAYQGGSGGCSYGCGTLFKITSSGSLTVFQDFSTDTGVWPMAPPIQGVDGNYYGVTLVYGDAYKLTPSGTFSALGPIPEWSHAPLLQATDGNFYGTTVSGGSSTNCSDGCGTVFRMTPKGVSTIVYNFDYTHGAYPEYGSLIQGSDGNLYGTALEGGEYGGGTVFELSPQGAITVLHNFPDPNYPDDGQELYAGLLQATDGNFYGVTYSGGTSGNGAIFRITPAGNYSILYNFEYSQGGSPESTPMQHTNGKIYGLAYMGGTSTNGVVYSFDMGLGPFVRLVLPAGKVGKTVEILGQGFTGTTGVSFNGTPATFTVRSDTFLTATVPTGVSTGYVTVTTPTGTLTSNKPFIVIP